jgi:hypothetical protein
MLIDWIANIKHQPADPPHSRKLGLLSTALVKVRVQGLATALGRVRDALEPTLLPWFPNGQFSWITLSIRLGSKNDDRPSFGRINKTYGDLPLSIEVDTHEILAVHHDPELLYELIYGYTLRALRAVAVQYGLSMETPHAEKGA